MSPQSLAKFYVMFSGLMGLKYELQKLKLDKTFFFLERWGSDQCLTHEVQRPKTSLNSVKLQAYNY